MRLAAVVILAVFFAGCAWLSGLSGYSSGAPTDSGTAEQ
jgi:hypothetical protein